MWTAGVCRPGCQAGICWVIKPSGVGYAELAPRLAGAAPMNAYPDHADPQWRMWARTAHRRSPFSIGPELARVEFPTTACTEGHCASAAATSGRWPAPTVSRYASSSGAAMVTRRPLGGGPDGGSTMHRLSTLLCASLEGVLGAARDAGQASLTRSGRQFKSWPQLPLFPLFPPLADAWVLLHRSKSV